MFVIMISDLKPTLELGRSFFNAINKLQLVRQRTEVEHAHFHRGLLPLLCSLALRLATLRRCGKLAQLALRVHEEALK